MNEKNWITQSSHKLAFGISIKPSRNVGPLIHTTIGFQVRDAVEIVCQILQRSMRLRIPRFGWQLGADMLLPV